MLLDTSFLIDVLRNKPPALELRSRLASAETLLVPAPSVMELWAGVIRGKKTQRAIAQLEVFLTSLQVISLDAKSAKRAAEIEIELLQKGELIQTEGLMIAGIAMSNGETLVTRDEHFARIPGLKLLKY